MKRRFRESADDTLFILSGAEVEVYEDSYEEGEGDYVNGYSVDIHGRYTLKELMKMLSGYPGREFCPPFTSCLQAC